MVSYDRIFESNNLTTEMISGERKNLTMREFLLKVHQSDNDELGNVFVKYLSPINVK
jgi:hypothetical protein